MKTLYHLWLSPYCRKVRIVLAEKKIDYRLETENTWLRRREFLAINPAGEVPVLIEDDGTSIADSQTICEYLEEVVPDPSIFPADLKERAEARRIVAWFDRKFSTEVSENLVGEKIFKRFLKTGAPNSALIRAGQQNIHYHLDYIGWLSERRNWLAGGVFSIADIAAAAHLSSVDYLGDVPWEDHISAKEWYVRIKSRPSFRAILADHLPGEPPPKHYADLDF
ncbi:MAG: glutathione S-transferase family protein [Pseudomonadota bacterium]|jgi:glutathione S-transferase|nr:glutathione S-transferase family protein [Pseudomonadota bacterium]MEC9077950.1 glutathione S-transferase family protein [Pseudomonadota bacterium]